MEIKILTQNDLTDFFLGDPSLCVLGVSDEQLVCLHKRKFYLMQPGTTYVGFYSPDLIAVVAMETFTHNTVSPHMYLRTNLRGQSKATLVQKEFKDYILENTHFTKAVCPVPSVCTHVIQPLIKWGFVLEGCLTNAISWRNQVVDLHLYALDLIRSDK